MKDLKNLGLSENDFQTIFEALEAFPNKDAAGDLFGALLGSFVPEGKAREDYQRQEEIKRKEKERKRNIAIENIRVLQGKMIALKRLLVEERLLKDFDDIINP